MVPKHLTTGEIRCEGLLALLERLGPNGTIRFLQQYETSRGDYTKERRKWLSDVTVDEVVKRRGTAAHRDLVHGVALLDLKLSPSFAPCPGREA